MARNSTKGASKPRVFIGSSVEALAVAKAIETGLHHKAEVTLWETLRPPTGQPFLTSLIAAAREFDFAVLVFAPDDEVVSRKKTSRAPRDNVLIELGLFIGILGHERVFVVQDRDKKVKAPSDLGGIVLAEYYGARDDDNVNAAVNPACTQMLLDIKRLGRRERPSGKSDSSVGLTPPDPALESTSPAVATDSEIKADNHLGRALLYLAHRGRVDAIVLPILAEHLQVRPPRLQHILDRLEAVEMAVAVPDYSFSETGTAWEITSKGRAWLAEHDKI